MTSTSPAPTPLTRYQKRLLIFLSVACFFEGYDFFALAQLLPNLRNEMGLSPGEGGLMVTLINLGSMFAYLLVSKADKWGRKRVLTITITGYTLCSLLTGLSSGPVSFTFFQVLARLFLIGEWAVAMVYAAEEFPADRRGMAIGVIQACSSLGAVTCAGVVPLLLATPWGWRTVYFVGTVPLIIVALARRSLRETTRFSQLQASSLEPRRIFHIFSTPYRHRMLLVALIWTLTYLCTSSAITFWKEFVTAERAFTDADVGRSMTIAAVASMPFIFLSGKLLDALGRKLGAAMVFILTAAGVVGAYSLHSKTALTASLMLGIFGVTAVLPVLNAYTAELFPTDLRSDAYAWANNVLGRVGYVISPALVGGAAEFVGWGPAAASTAVFPLIALLLIVLFLPETKGRELEETSAL